MDSSYINPTYVDIHPVKKSYRMVVHFGDLFLNFFLALFLFSVAVFPLGKKISHYDEITSETETLRYEMTNVLFENGLLVKETQEDDFTTAFSYSADLYLKGFLTEDTEHEYFRHYFLDLLGESNQSYLDFYKEHDSGYFTFDTEVKLKEEYRELFLPLLDEKDTLSNEGDTRYQSFMQSYFPSLYSALLEDMKTNESITDTNPLFSYRLNQNRIDDNTTTQHWIITYCSYLSYLISALIYFFMVPMISHRGKTLAMMAFRVERVGKDNLRLIRRRERPLQFIFYFLFDLSLMMFLPMMFIDFVTLFSIPGLFTVSFVGLILSFISFVFMLFNPLGRTLSDVVSKSVYLSKDDLEKILEIKGFKVEHE